MKAFDELVAKIAEAEAREREAIGVDELESVFVAVLEFIKTHTELRPKAVEEFSKHLRDVNRAPHGLLEFCMHELKWPEMRAEAEEILAECTETVVRNKLYGAPSQHLHYLENVLSSFGQSWESKDLFSY
jgi:hypothetical protein